MGALDSIRMGYRCKAWSLQSDVPPAYQSVISSGPSAQGTRWIVSATTAERLRQVTEESAVVLDGGPRWVLSTALGFVTGGPWWTAIFAFLFFLGNCAIFVHTVSDLTRSGSETVGIAAYMILAAVISMASVPGAWLASGWKDLACGLAVEMGLCVSLVGSVANVYCFVGPYVADSSGLSPYADLSRWVTPAVVWAIASRQREVATNVIEVKLANLWCRHPDEGRLSHQQTHSLWDEWSGEVEECAKRVGGYSMLGFSTSDLDTLAASLPSAVALKTIQKLRSGLSRNGVTTEPWIRQSLAFMAGYDARHRVGEPISSHAEIELKDIGEMIKILISQCHPEVENYQTDIDNSCKKEEYLVSEEDEHYRWFYAGALLADSDRNSSSVRTGRKYGPRLAVSLAFLVEGTDPLARLHCYAEDKITGSSLKSLRSAISSSTEALVFDQAASAGVSIAKDALGVRGLACATDSKVLNYSPDEMVAASHLDEAVVIYDGTFARGQPEVVFERLWEGSAIVDKLVDVSDMVPLAASAPEEAGASAKKGWLLHVGFMLAVLTSYFLGSSKVFVVLFLVTIPATDTNTSVHMDNHFYMIYISWVLNYIRFASRRVSLKPRGKATIEKANNSRLVAFLFVNVLPVLGFTVFSGWEWWLDFSPCILSTLPGFLNTARCCWGTAFKYEWRSWHELNWWYSGRSYVKCVNLRKRVGRNILAVNTGGNGMTVAQVLPFLVSPSSQSSAVKFMVVGGQS